MKKINWDIFFDNSSTCESLCEFVAEKKTFKWLSDSCWPLKCKDAVKKMKRRGYKKSIRAAKKALSKLDYDWKDFG